MKKTKNTLKSSYLKLKKLSIVRTKSFKLNNYDYDSDLSSFNSN